MSKVNVHEAKTRFSRLLRRVAAGEEITIANRGVPVARLVPVQVGERTRQLGFFRGQMTTPDDFDAPLPAKILDAFEGKAPEPARRTKAKRKKS
jgi:prevent-host-death family protein